MSQQSLGEKLKDLRESQGITRDQLYSRTKILVKYIEALEDGRWDLLPGKAYLKPFVKNITGVLGADYREFYEFIETQTEKATKPEPEKKTKGFDYRWLAVILMIGLIAIIVFILNPLKSDDKPVESNENSTTVIEPGNNHAILERDYSSDLDIETNMFEGKTLHRIELTATDTVWVVLTSALDTLYTGLLTEGRSIARESLEPFVIVMGKSNCMNIKYNGIQLDRQRYLLNRRRIDLGNINLLHQPQSGGSVEGL